MRHQAKWQVQECLVADQEQELEQQGGLHPWMLLYVKQQRWAHLLPPASAPAHRPLGDMQRLPPRLYLPLLLGLGLGLLVVVALLAGYSV